MMSKTIEQDIEKYKKEKESLTKKLDVLKNEKAVLTAEYKRIKGQIHESFPDLDESAKSSEILLFLEKECVRLKEELDDATE